MGFFDDVSRIGADTPYPRGGPWDPPEAEFPGVGASALLLARTGAVAVAVTAIWACTTGFEFWIKAQFRHGERALETQPDDQCLHVGLQFADGRKAANVGSASMPWGTRQGRDMETR
jgi:hypothetical protein